MQLLRAGAKADTTRTKELNPIMEDLSAHQGDHDKKVWSEHREFARSVASALEPGSRKFDSRLRMTSAPNSNEAKVEKAADYASALKQVLENLKLPELQNRFRTVLARHNDDLSPKLETAIGKVFSGTREIVDTLTKELKELPIPKFEFKNMPGAIPNENFWENIQALGLNTEF